MVATTTIAMISANAGAAVITSQGFEASASTGWTYALAGSGGAVSSESLATDSPASSRIRSGSFSFQHSSTASTAQSSTLTFDPISLESYDSTQVELRLASISETSNNGNDNSDVVQVFIALNGAAFSTTPDLTVEGNGNARWSYTSGTGVAQVTVGVPVAKFQPAAGGNRTTDGYGQLLLNIPDSATSLAMRVVSTNNNTGEIWAIDDISINGTAIPEPASLGLISIGGLTLLARRRRQTV